MARLTLEQRHHIEAHFRSGLTGARIAGLIGVHRSTVSREFARNGAPDAFRRRAAALGAGQPVPRELYRAVDAQAETAKRRVGVGGRRAGKTRLSPTT